MVALVACETLLLVLLTLLVAGLLRSHAEILRRLGPPEGDAGRDGASLPDAARRADASEGYDVVGTSLELDAVKIGLGEGGPPTLLAFLTSGCTICLGFWDGLREGTRPRELPATVRVVVVTKDPSHESPTRLRELAPANVPVVMSSAAWSEYRVPAAPYFVYLEGGQVHGEGSASGWKQIASLLRDAIDDAADGRSRGEERTGAVDQALAAAGIGPGHQSLYPAGRQRRNDR
jgi:hypothetical protein